MKSVVLISLATLALSPLTFASPSSQINDSKLAPPPIYYTTNGLNIQSDALTTLNTNNIKSVDLGTPFIKKGAACTYQNLWDGVSSEDVHKDAIQSYVKAGNKIQFVFGGNPGTSSDDPFLVCDQKSLTNTIDGLITNFPQTSGVDFDIENNIHDGSDDQNFWDKIGGTIKALQSEHKNLHVTITIPQDTPYYAAGYNQAMEKFFSSYGADVTLNLIFNFPGQTTSILMNQFKNSMQQSLQAIEFKGNVTITAAWPSQANGIWHETTPVITNEDQSNFNQTMTAYVKNLGATYAGTSIWAADKPYDGKILPLALQVYNTVAGNKPGPGPGPGPQPTANGLTINYINSKQQGWGQVECYTNSGRTTPLAQLPSSNAIPGTGPSGSQRSVYCQLNNTANATFTANKDDTAWTITVNNDPQNYFQGSSCNKTTCTLS